MSLGGYQRSYCATGAFYNRYGRLLEEKVRMLGIIGATVREQVSRSIMEVMYDEQDAAFYVVYRQENVKVKILTPIIFYPA